MDKPELFTFAEIYGSQTESEYDFLAAGLNEIQLESLNFLMQYVYKEGIKDGIKLYMKLDTN